MMTYQKKYSEIMPEMSLLHMSIKKNRLPFEKQPIIIQQKTRNYYSITNLCVQCSSITACTLTSSATSLTFKCLRKAARRGYNC